MATAETHDEHHAHPSESQYWIVFGILAVITAVEVAWSYLGFEGPALVWPLVIMMVVKFVLVGGVFMHLRSDMKMINGRAFTLIFLAGLMLAILVFFIVFGTFRFAI